MKAWITQAISGVGQRWFGGQAITIGGILGDEGEEEEEIKDDCITSALDD